ncbi:MAG: FkbM family methyltransferase [Sphingobacteriales bacterium]|jgi:hypothetical protein|nr:FkbM family methyltransferase [Sphingobacteriales bacterium]
MEIGMMHKKLQYAERKHNLFLLFRSKLINVLKSTMVFLGVYPSRASSKEQLLKFLKQNGPVGCNKELIRLGSSGDGGYLIPNDLEGIKYCFSPGVSDNSDFELDCAKKGMNVFLADMTVDAPAISHENFNFIKKFIGAVPNQDFMTLDSWINNMIKDDTNQDLILQMDVEGYEYEILLSLSLENLKKFRIIIIEFHTLENILSSPYFKIIQAVFDKLRIFHSCVHIHPNNCYPAKRIKGIQFPYALEYTFYRNDRFIKNENIQIPHSLDQDNTINKKIVLSEEWYGVY